MTSFFSLTIGEMQQFHVALHNGGLTAELAKKIGNDAALGNVMVEALIAHLDPPAPCASASDEPSGGHPYRGGDKKEPKDTLTVPDLSPADLVARARSVIKLTYLFDGLATWDFSKDQDGQVIDYRGKRYEVLTWKPGRYISTDEVRKHFKELDADGNTAAFIAWIAEHSPKGYYASIPADDKQLWRDPESGYLCAPGFDRDGGNRGLRLYGVHNGWGGHWVFVAFRELPPV